MVRIGKHPMDEGGCVGTIPLRDAFQAFGKGGIRTTGGIRGEEAARQTVDGLRNAGLQLGNLCRGVPSVPRRLSRCSIAVSPPASAPLPDREKGK
jgi:hypothetical protein